MHRQQLCVHLRFGSNTIEWASGERVPLAEVRAWTDSNLPVAAAKEEEGFIVL